MLAAIRPRQRRPWAYTPGELDFEVGFYLAKRRWGQGFAAEAAYAALKDPPQRLQLSKVCADHRPDNRASERNLKRSDLSLLIPCSTILPHPS